MDINSVLNCLLIAAFIAVGIALVFFIIELIKVMKTTRATIESVKTQMEPLLADAAEMTNSLKPAVAKVDPLVDRVQLTLDAANLEIMRVDGILENVSEITNAASSATAAVDNITNAPIKAVNSVTSRMRSKLGSKKASEESERLAEKRSNISDALNDYKAAEAQDAKKADVKNDAPVPNAAGVAAAGAVNWENAPIADAQVKDLSGFDVQPAPEVQQPMQSDFQGGQADVAKEGVSYAAETGNLPLSDIDLNAQAVPVAQGNGSTDDGARQFE